jgi:hypothetical protein
VAYDTKELEKKALKVIEAENLVFIHEVASFMNISKVTFYEHKLNELNSLKDALEANKEKMKKGLRKKWYDNDNATTQIALYKLIGTQEETERINSQKVDIGGELSINVNFASDD